MRYEIIANVRKRGSIGVFYPSPHLVEASNIQQAKNQWFVDYEAEWELNNFIRIRPESADAQRLGELQKTHV